MSEQDLKTVSEASDILGVSIDTIRRWEKKGLIRAWRSENNFRLFSIDELERLRKKMRNDNSSHEFKVLVDKERSQFSCVDLFAGAGGTALGFHNAGIDHELLVEIDKDAANTLKFNMPEWNVKNEDVRTVDFKGVKADVVEGGFPCQAFSYAGKKLGFADVRGTMFFEFARCVSEIRPKVAMGENVKGLLNHDEGRTLKTILQIFDDIGYKVAYKVLKAQHYDVPQKRERLILMAIRKDVDFPILFPKEKDYIMTIRDALNGCPISAGSEYPAGKKAILDLIPEGGYWKDLPLNLQKEYMGASFHMGGGKTGMARRLAWDEPSLTLTCSPAQKQTERCHPEFTRPLTVREYARIQTFPDDWQFTGSVANQYKQIGNAVPVNLAYHLGRSVKSMLEGKIDDDSEVA